ncbi:hypothetical protein FRC10_008494 [Ceratobasidium sp. 414]|nr:hypothetical protein FRC10_008494 [Ceratobasidium sp. 414]
MFFIYIDVIANAATDQDADEGALAIFSQSVGVHIPPPAQGTFTSEQVKKQKAITMACGNASRPGALSPPPKRHKANNPSAKTPTNYQFEDLDTKEDQMEWLYQALESLSVKKNYHQDLDFDDSAVLFEVYKDLCHSGDADHDDTLPPEPKTKVKTGMTKALEHRKSGPRLSVPLVRTDDTVIGLDGLGGAPPLPPRANAPHHPSTPNPSTKSHGHKPPVPPTSAPKTGQPKPLPKPGPPTNKPIPSKKGLVISCTRVEAIHKENAVHQAAKGNSASTNAPAKGVSSSSGLTLKPPHPRQHPGPSNTEMERPPPKPSNEQARGASPVGDETNEEVDDDINDNDANDDEGNARHSKSRAKHENWLLHNFGPEAAPLVKYVIANLKVNMPAVYEFNLRFGLPGSGSLQTGNIDLTSHTSRSWICMVTM